MLQVGFGTEQTNDTAGPGAITEEGRDVDEVEDGLRNGGGQKDVLEEAVLWRQDVIEVIENAACVVVRLVFLLVATEALIHFINHEPSQSWPLVRRFLHLV